LGLARSLFIARLEISFGQQRYEKLFSFAQGMTGFTQLTHRNDAGMRILRNMKVVRPYLNYESFLQCAPKVFVID